MERLHRAAAVLIATVAVFSEFAGVNPVADRAFFAGPESPIDSSAYKLKVPFVSNPVVSPPFLGLLPSTGSSSKSETPNNSMSNEVKSSSQGLKMLPSQSEEPISLTETDRQLIYTKKEISQAPIVSDDPDLYAPLFRNVLVFKRSYELMELLKVYIYRDGQRPIFHAPVLKDLCF